MSETEPPSTPDFEVDDTRKILVGIKQKMAKQEGAATVWRALGGVAVTVALALGGWAVTYAQQAAVDHERVGRLETDATQSETDQRAIRADLEQIRAALARIEGRLEDR